MLKPTHFPHNQINLTTYEITEHSKITYTEAQVNLHKTGKVLAFFFISKYGRFTHALRVTDVNTFAQNLANVKRRVFWKEGYHIFLNVDSAK